MKHCKHRKQIRSATVRLIQEKELSSILRMTENFPDVKNNIRFWLKIRIYC